MELIYPTLKTHIEVSKARRAVYYKKNDKLPKKIKNYTVNNKGYLLNELGEKIVKNERSVGKPKYIKLNFNLMWSGKIHYILRSKIKLELHEYFKSCKSQRSPFLGDDLLKIEFYFYRPDSEKQDIDNNSFFYIKSFFDYLQESKIILNDSQIKEFNVKLIQSNTSSLLIKIDKLNEIKSIY